jgi:prepilin-type N-terminal cleavage/methylation domain-containing protein
LFSKNFSYGFTLVELLVSLAILTVIVAVTIPKILISQRDVVYNANAKEAISSIRQAYELYGVSNQVTSGFKLSFLIPYLNYVALDTTSGSIDRHPGQLTINCTASNQCIKLHNGSVVMFENNSFGGTATTNEVSFWFDPDGRVTDGTTNGPGKSAVFFIYTNGRVVSHEGVLPGSANNAWTASTCLACIPSWFHWEQ